MFVLHKNKYLNKLTRLLEEEKIDEQDTCLCI